MAAMVAAVLRLPLSAVVLATVLTASAGLGAQPLIVVAAVVAFVATSRLEPTTGPPPASRTPAAAG
jgi:hypothetical protein